LLRLKRLELKTNKYALFYAVASTIIYKFAWKNGLLKIDPSSVYHQICKKQRSEENTAITTP
jgi:hypothetical protein